MPSLTFLLSPIRDRVALSAFAVAALFLVSTTAWPRPVVAESVAKSDSLTIILEEALGYDWSEAVVRRTVEAAPGQLPAEGLGLFDAQGNRVAAQVEDVETHEDGSLARAEVWFFSDLPADGRWVFDLRPAEGDGPVTRLALQRKRDLYVLRNGETEAHVLAGWSPDDDGEAVPGPLRGVTLPSGQTTGAMLVLPATPVVGVSSEVTADGPIFKTLRVTYQFDGEASYVVDVTLRARERMVRIDEWYENAGELTVELPFNTRPDKVWFQSYPATVAGKHFVIDPGKEGEIIRFEGWDWYLANRAPAFGLIAGDKPSSDYLGVLATDADWLPRPYESTMLLMHDPADGLSLAGSINSGHRHWALLMQRASDFEHPATSLYKLRHDRFIIPLEKVVNWRLTWPEMDLIVWPHTFFDPDDVPRIREKLTRQPVIADLFEDMNMRSATQLAARYLVHGEEEDIKALADPEADMSPLPYLDWAVGFNVEEAGFFTHSRLDYMNLTDQLMQRIVGLEFVLGSDHLSREEKRRVLAKIAFLQYVLHEPAFAPPVYPQGPMSYIMGTQNQRLCLITVRGMLAAMLAGHPEQQAWIDRAIEANVRTLPLSLSEHGVHLESPFYSSRDTMRFWPFWTAVRRKGGADTQGLFERSGKTFVYLAQMLTPPDPRLGGVRTYWPFGRSSTGVIDPTFMIGADPWARDNSDQGRLMRWVWEEQGQPSPWITGATGGRDLSLTLIAMAQMLEFEPFDEPPLKSRYWPGFGSILRTHVGREFESNVMFRHDRFAHEYYAANNGAVYMYAKGSPLLGRFGAYWMYHTQPTLMSIPFGNRILFESGENRALGDTERFVAMGDLADYAQGLNGSGDWRRRVLFAKDLDKADPLYLLVRDDITRNTDTAAHWWIMSKTVQPEGIESPGVVSIKGKDPQWIAKMGENWPDAPNLSGPTHSFPGHFGVDLDMHIALPAKPELLTDAVGTGPRQAYNVNPRMYEFQQLVRIKHPERVAGEPVSYLTLFAPRLSDEPGRRYRTIADGAGVAVEGSHGKDRLILATEMVTYADDLCAVEAPIAFVRVDASGRVRMMVEGGSVEVGGVKLTSNEMVAAIISPQRVEVFHAGPRNSVTFDFAPQSAREVRFTQAEEGAFAN